MKHWRTWIASSGLVAVLAIAYVVADTPAGPQDPQGRFRAGGPLGPIFELFDADGDGQVTRAELSQADAVFDKLDTNTDGVLNAADLPRRHGRRMAAGLATRLAQVADTDASGDVTEAEWQAVVASIETDADGRIVPESLHEVLGIDHPVGTGHGPGPMSPPTAEDLNALFDRLDRDDNGVLDDTELTPDRPARGRRHGMRGPRGGGPAAMADADQDGEVTATEWEALFESLDADGDGILTRAELQAGRPDQPRMRREFRAR